MSRTSRTPRAATTVTRAENRAGQDVNVLLTTARNNPDINAYFWRCTGCQQTGPEHGETGLRKPPARQAAQEEAADHAQRCEFAPPR